MWRCIKGCYVEVREQRWWIAGLGLLEHEGLVLLSVAVAGGEHAAVDVAEELGNDLGVGAAGERGESRKQRVESREERLPSLGDSYRPILQALDEAGEHTGDFFQLSF